MPRQKREVAMHIYSSKYILIVFFTLLVLIGLDRSIFAGQGEFSVEGFGGGGVGPEDGSFGVSFNSTAGGGAGIAYEVAENLQLKLDIGYYQWGKAGSGAANPWTCNFTAGVCSVTRGTVDEKLYDTPIFLGERYVFRLNNGISPFLELGMTANILEAKYNGTLLCTACSSVQICCPVVLPAFVQISETARALRFGVAPGFGVKYMLTQHMDFGTAFRYDFVQDGVGNAHNVHPSFFSFSFFAAYRI